MKRLSQYIDENKDFYLRTLSLAVPMILQQLITNFVSMIDNVMIGMVGTPQMNGVSIANQLIFVFNITAFGGISGASIFGTQFFGKGDHEGQKYTVRFRLLLTLIVITLAALIFHFFGNNLISLYISPEDAASLKAETLNYGKNYLELMILGILPFAIGQAYSSAIRECGETKIPMLASMAAIGVNVILDYVLIFGKLGCPKLGVTGAAIATVIAKYIEALLVIIWAHTHSERNRYIIDLYKSFYIPPALAKEILIKGCPLLINEFLWSLSVSVVAQCYSVRGLDVVAARNIASTLVNLFGVVYIQLGAAIGIIIGFELGAGRHEKARESAAKLRIFSIVITVLVALCMIPIARLFPMLYNTTDQIKDLAAFFIIIQALAMPFWSYTNACYFILRSGGKTGITFLYDFLFSWFLVIPLSYILTKHTNLEIHPLFIILTFSEVVKCLVGFFMVKSGIWINTIVSECDNGDGSFDTFF